MSANVTDLVFGSWNKIFNKQLSKKEVNIEWGIDTEISDDNTQKQAIYLQFLLKDRDSQYRISERSLGFRWFFVFLLLTQFRNSRLRKSRKVLFLFDEPASNLHSAAQTQLLDSFEKLGNVVYTTHSHHLVNPNWLENTYVVKNEGLDYEKEDDFSAKKSKVILLPYRAFVAKYPSQTTYFQPVLDVLEYYPSRLENIPDVVITEGKNDYYTMLYMQLLLGKEYAVNILPGTSASNLDGPIQLYLAWGRKFIALLDSDKEGIGQKKRYLDVFGPVVKEKVITLADVNNLWSNFSCENLIADDDKLRLLHTKYPSSQVYDKVLFNRAIQENLINKTVFEFSESSLENFRLLFTVCKSLLVA
jgi:energy-coupling factor transporter ATP-binding protein EcfA2